MLLISGGAEQRVAEDTSAEWYTVAANAQRTSWVPEEIDPSQLDVEWYRPIEAYIPQNVQVIAANGLLYISTARGLYALYASDPDGSGPLGAGDEKWRFDTEMPLGNSPTVVNGVAYVGGFDRKLHALDAFTGTHLWSFDGADAGYSANPLVADGLVLVGNRDGNFYAIGAHGSPQEGQLLWKFKAGGPISLSAAYADGVVYFVADDNFAYALKAATANASGELLWKSAKLPGGGFSSYWPVVYRDKVIFAGSPAYRNGIDPGTGSIKDNRTDACTGGCPYETYDRVQKDDLFFDKTDVSPVGPVVSTTEPWAAGKTVIDGSRVSEYLEDNPDRNAHFHKPWRRTVVVLNRTDGSEFTYDSDGDGHPEYAPIAWWGTRSGSAYPPVVGPDGVPYQSNVYQGEGPTAPWNIPHGQVMGWKVGTPYLSLVGADGAVDEPQAISAGGSMLYRSICSDRVGSWVSLTDPDNQGTLWGYDLASQAPGYDEMWWGIDPDGLPRLTGNYGTLNGVYHNHGVQNPLVPYQGSLFIHRSNAVIAYGPGPKRGKLPLVRVGDTRDSLRVPTPSELRSRLEAEVQRMVDSGNLRPAYYNTGQVNDERMVNYFENPGDTLYTLSVAYPHLSATLQQQVRSYLQTEFQSYFDPTMYARRGWSEGQARDATAIPPEVAASMSGMNKSTWTWHVGDQGVPWYYPQNNLYAMWKYAQVLGGDPYVQRVYELAKAEVEVPVSSVATAEYFKKWPWYLNGYIAGYTGFLRLQELAGKDVADVGLRAEVQTELTRLLDLRVSIFSKDSYWVDPSNPNLPASDGDYHRRAFNVSRNFIMLVPELGQYLRDRAPSRVQEAIAEYHKVAPYWFVSKYDAAVDEGAAQVLDDSPALLSARAYILKEPYEELTKYLDAPAFPVGDLFYIQNLVAVLDSAGAPPAVPTTTVTALTTTTPGGLGLSLSLPTANAANVPLYDKFELTFNVNNSAATNPQFPYDPAPPAGLAGRTGISVEGLFLPPGQTDWQQALRQPGFLYQGYQSQQVAGSDWIHPVGQPVWKVRFAPRQPGTWQYRVRAQDASICADGLDPCLTWVESGTGSFTVGAALSGNHGFIEVSRTDDRYFAFSDGGRFAGVGHNLAFSDIGSLQDAEARLDSYSANGVDFVRVWMSESDIAGSSWSPWATIPTYWYGGYIPDPGLDNAPLNSGNDFSLSLDQEGGRPRVFNGWTQGKIAVKPNTTYTLSVTAKVSGVAGPRDASHPNYGFTAKVGWWPEQRPDGLDVFPNLVPYLRDGGWSTLEGQIRTGPDQQYLDFLYLVLDNVTSGKASVSQVSLKEVMSDGTPGPELLAKSRGDAHMDFNQASRWSWASVLHPAAQRGFNLNRFFRDTHDRVWNRINPDGSLGTDDSANANFYAWPGTKVRRLHEYYWRYLAARWGYSTAVHSWELLNEGDPYNREHYEQTNSFASYMKEWDRNHLVTTSFWHSYPADEFWKSSCYPYPGYADIHAYTDTSPVSLDPHDGAAFHLAVSQYVGSFGVGKPTVRGETGIGGTGGEDPSLARDVQGVWLHNFTWAQLDPGAMYELYWYTQNITGNNLLFQYRPYHDFMVDIPLDNGRYRDAEAAASSNGVRVVGQKDPETGRAHLWIQNRSHTWWNVVNGVPWGRLSGTVTLPGLAPDRGYTAEYWLFDDAGNLTKQESALAANSMGELVLDLAQLPAVVTDLAVKVTDPSLVGVPTQTLVPDA